MSNTRILNLEVARIDRAFTKVVEDDGSSATLPLHWLPDAANDKSKLIVKITVVKE